MRRLWLIIALIALGGCATVYEDRYGYYGDSGYGDYYYDREPAARVSFGLGYGYGYGAYDSLFWGLQHSYLDPFWYPGFYYGVTYFPSYYGWSSWHAGDYWRWRNFHPYSPYYGSYWDHYYDWRPRHGHRHGGFRDGNHGDPQRYGSARNAAERMARSRGIDSRRDAWRTQGVVPSRNAAYARGVTGSRDAPVRAGNRGGESLRSRGYAPDVRRSPETIGARGEADFGRGRVDRAVDGRGFAPRRSENPRLGSPEFTRRERTPMAGDRYPSVRGNRDPAPNVRSAPRFFEPRGVVAEPAPRASRQAAPASRPPVQARPSSRGSDGMPSMRSSRSSGDSGRSSSGRGSARGRSER